MIEIRPRETVVLSKDFEAMVAWYRDVLGFRVVKLFEDGFNYANLETDSGIQLGIGVLQDMGIEPLDRTRNTVILQIEVDDLKAFFAHVEAHGGTVSFGPAFDKKGEFWFGGISDPEGNPLWVVDANCP